MFQSIQKQVLPDQIFEQIRDQILLGHLKVGDHLPSERKLCALFNVNRGAIREALKKLQQLGLIHIQQGGKTQVLNFYQTASINLLPDLLLLNQQMNPHVVYSVLELRLALGQDVARLCSIRMNETQRQQLQNIVQDMQATNDVAQRENYSSQFWHLLVTGANNIAYQLAFNTLSQTFTLMRTALHDLLAHEWNSIEDYQQLIVAMEHKQTQDIQTIINHLLTSPTQAQDFFATQPNVLKLIEFNQDLSSKV